MFRAAIFDMDGLLIDSEPYWKDSEREVFGSVGIDITDEMAAITARDRGGASRWLPTRPRYFASWCSRNSASLWSQAVRDRVLERDIVN